MQMTELYATLDEVKKHKVDAMLAVVFQHHRKLTHPLILQLYLIKREEFALQVSEGSL